MNVDAKNEPALPINARHLDRHHFGRVDSSAVTSVDYVQSLVFRLCNGLFFGERHTPDNSVACARKSRL